MDEPIANINAYAKINLSLKVTGRYPDGYHALDMVTVPVSVYDTVILYETEKKNSVSFCGRYSEGIDPVKNNILPVLNSFSDCYIHAQIIRNIPSAAGLGGSSAACGAVIRALKGLYPDKLTDEEINAVAIRAGADVPFFVSGGAARVTGRGETVDNFSTCKLFFIIAVSGEVLTGDCFRTYDKQAAGYSKNTDNDSLARALVAGDTIEAARFIGNDLTNTAVSLCPAVAANLNALSGTGALAVSMTGSGSACFALFSTREERDAAYLKLGNKDILFIKAENI